MVEMHVTDFGLEARCDCSSDSDFIKELQLGLDFLIAEYFKSDKTKSPEENLQNAIAFRNRCLTEIIESKFYNNEECYLDEELIRYK